MISITLLIIFIVFSLNKPDFMFWVAVFIFADPGGYIQVFITRSMLGGIQIWDLQFMLLFIPLISPKIKIKTFFKNKDAVWVLGFLSFFGLAYQILIYGLIVPGSFNSLLLFLGYERLSIFGFLSIIPAYLFFIRSYHLFFKFLFYISFVLVTLYIVTLITQIPLLPLWIFSRGLGTSAMRISMYSYGFADLFISISLVLLLFKIDILNKKAIYYIGLLMVVAVLLTLTRRSIIGLIFSMFMIYIIRQKFIGESVFSHRIYKMFFIGLFSISVLFVIKPSYLGFVFEMLQSSYSIVQDGSGRDGSQDIRFESDIPDHLARFNQSPIFGYGYDELWYSNDTNAGGLSANDVPLTAALGMYGIFGISFFSLYYLKLLNITKKTLRLLKYDYRNRFYRDHKILFIFMIVLAVIFINGFTINFMNLFSDLIKDTSRVQLMMLVGFFIAGNRIINNKIRLQ